MKPLHRRLLYSAIALLFLSGAAWTSWNYFGESRSDFEMAAKAWTMKIHGGAAMAILVLLGVLLAGHVPVAWRGRRNRVSGSLFLSAFVVLTITGYELYYVGGERLRAWASWIHLGMGLALPLLLILHVWLGKRTRIAVQPQKQTLSLAKINAV